MASKVSAIDTFKQAMLGCIELEKTKRGLGKMFHSAVIDLLNEHPGKTADELSALFVETMTEVENTLRSELVEAFGDEYDLRAEMPSWTQYKSDYKRALLKVDRRDLIKCGGIADVKKKLGEISKALKEKEEGGVSDDTAAGTNAAENGGGKAASNSDTYEVSDAVHGYVTEAMNILSKLDEDTAADVARHFRDAAAARMRKMGVANKKVGAVTSGAKKTEAA